MSMDKSAIEQIQSSVVVEKINEALNEHILDMPVIAKHDNYQLVNLEQYKDFRSRFRGSMSTDSVDDYVEYVKMYIATGSACFIDTAKMQANTIFNMGNTTQAGHCDFSSTLKLPKTAEFTAFLDRVDTQCSQKEMAEWLEDWRDFLGFSDGGGEHVGPAQAISAVRRLTVEAKSKQDHQVNNFSASRSTLESIEARSEHGLPDLIRFTCVPYLGLPPQIFECRLSIVTGSDKPRFVLHAKRMDYMLEQIAKDFQALLKERFGQLELATYLGSFAP